ncbi:hypothetical protein ACHHYP_06072 [Achlya hypogyna]|uniref:Uncharacterized protein n=1 Tax=Achlya hypogyna TaxID=1202772 RepID=A0A1V9ZNA3_ACHHY|nr:hypothetical protein ACHHYP_06072 [Achlya hypogyna]
MVAHGIRFMLGHVAGPKKPKVKGRQAGLITCLQTPSSVSHAFVEIATSVIHTQKEAEVRMRADSNNHKAPVYPLLQPDVLDSLECALFMDVKATTSGGMNKSPRTTVGDIAKLLVQLWEILLASVVPWAAATLQETVGFNDQLKRQKAESLIVKLMERREFAKVYEAYLLVLDDSSCRWSKADLSGASSSPLSDDLSSRKSTWGSRRRQTATDTVFAVEAPPLAKDPVRLLERYMQLVTHTVAYAADMVSVHRPFFLDVLSILYCRLPSVQRITLDIFDRFGFSGSPGFARARRSTLSVARHKSFFQEDNSAFYGWHRLGHIVDLDAIDSATSHALDVLVESHGSLVLHDSESDIFDDAPDGDNNARSSSFVDSSLCLDVFLSLWMATTEHIQRTSRGHIPWSHVPPFAALDVRARNVFEKSFAYQTFDCDEDTNGLRFRLIAARKEKLDRRLPFDVKHPRVVFSTVEAVMLLTKQSYAPYLRVMLKHTDCFYVRSAVPCLALLEGWIIRGTPMAFEDEETQALLLKYIAKLLVSERMDQLKAIQIFLLHCLGHCSMELQQQVLQLLVDAFPVLFGHWSRDVRFCYHLLLIYLFDDRRQLGAKSDAILLGYTDHNETQARFAPFDKLLLDTLGGCRADGTSMVYERMSFTEYINQLEMYFSMATVLPTDEAVAIPRIKIQNIQRA